MYTQWVDTYKKKERMEEQFFSYYEEISYRKNQVNAVFKDVEKYNKELDVKLSKDSPVTGGTIRDYLESAKRITVVSVLGGISSFPPSEDEKTVAIGSSRCSGRSLPFGRGYKNPKYENYSLIDLINAAYRIKFNGKENSSIKDELYDAIIEFSESAKFIHDDIVADWVRRHQALGEYKVKYGGAYKVYNMLVSCQ